MSETEELIDAFKDQVKAILQANVGALVSTDAEDNLVEFINEVTIRGTEAITAADRRAYDSSMRTLANTGERLRIRALKASWNTIGQIVHATFVTATSMLNAVHPLAGAAVSMGLAVAAAASSNPDAPA